MQSFWEEERKNYKEYESIRNDMRASVCVIGGGLTGLTTAYYLSKYTNVVLLERDRICSHTSGRNTGKVTSQHEVFYRYLIDSQGKEFAKKYLGYKYVAGGSSPSTGFDCSGFTYYVFKNKAGIVLPRTSSAQSKYGTYVSKSNLKAGDLVFFDTNGANDGNVSHVGMYIGNNEFIHAANSKKGVIKSTLTGYYDKKFINARRP